MRLTIRSLREALHGAIACPWDRVTAAGTLGAMALCFAHIDYPDSARFLLVWWGASAGVYGLLGFLAVKPSTGATSETDL